MNQPQFDKSAFKWTTKIKGLHVRNTTKNY